MPSKYHSIMKSIEIESSTTQLIPNIVELQLRAKSQAKNIKSNELKQTPKHSIQQIEWELREKPPLNFQPQRTSNDNITPTKFEQIDSKPTLAQQIASEPTVKQ